MSAEEQKFEELRSTIVICTSALLQTLALLSPAICRDGGGVCNQINRLIERLPAP